MRIGFNARYMSASSRRGFNRYTYSLAKALGRLDGVEVFLISEDPVHESFLADLPVKVVAVRGVRHLWWEQVILPRLIHELRLDIFHAPGSIGLPFRKVCPYVLTFHDAIGAAAAHLTPRQPSWIRVHHRARERMSLRRADAIITGSNHAKGEIVRWLGVAPQRLAVIPDGVEEKFHVLDSGALAAVTARYELRRRYVLYVGGFERRKNVTALVGAFARSHAGEETDLVLVGEQTSEARVLAGIAEGLGVGARTRFLGCVPDDDLPALYNAAAVFVYPSLYEGFGLQLVEAMACGVPVVAADRSSMSEVLDGAGMLVNPEKVGEMAAAMDSVFFDREVASRLRRRGLEVARHLSWERTARETVRVYGQVLPHASRGCRG